MMLSHITFLLLSLSVLYEEIEISKLIDLQQLTRENAENFDQNWTDLEEYAQQLRDRTGIPAVAVGVLQKGKVVDAAVIGERSIGGAPVQSRDQFHWGSITKSVTGTVIAGLIEEGKLGWESTLAELLPDIDMHPAYREVTIWQLMGHQAGVTQLRYSEENHFAQYQESESDTSTDLRARFTADILKETPIDTPGQSAIYSNAGIAVAGYVAEVASGKSWRQLVQEYVFDRARMLDAGFDFPASEENPNQPRGYYGNGPEDFTELELVPQEGIGPFATLDPAGNIRSSLFDMLKYGQMHIDGINGIDGPFQASTLQRLHTPFPGASKFMGKFH